MQLHHQYRAPPPPRSVRQFTQLGMPLSRAFQDCCSALRHAIQDLIDQGLVDLGRPGVATDPLPTHDTRAVPPPPEGTADPQAIQFDSGQDLWAASSIPVYLQHVPPMTPFILFPEEYRPPHRDVQIVTWSGRVAQPPPVDRPFAGIAAREEIRVDTATTPKGLIHMLTVDRATCIVFSDDDLPPEGSNHVRPLFIDVVVQAVGVLSVLLDNGSALNVYPLVKFIHEGRIITKQSDRDIITSSEPVLHISHSENDLHLTGFTFDEVQVVSLEDDSRDMVPMSFDQHNNTLVLSMMRGMSYLPGMGLDHRQQGPHEFTFAVDHNTPYGLGYISTEVDARYMARLRRDRVRARMTGIPFDYPLRPYTFQLADYFIRGSEHTPGIEGTVRILETVEIQDIQQALGQMHLDTGTTETPGAMIVAPPSPDRASVFFMCFPDEVPDYDLPMDLGDGIDEMDMIGIGCISRILDVAPRGPHSAFDIFGVFVLDDELVLDVVTSDFISVEGASDSVDTPLSSDTMSGFVIRFDDIYDENNDMSIFEYLTVSQHFPLIAPPTPTTHIYDVDNVGDTDDPLGGQSECDSDTEDEKVTPISGSTELIDFGAPDQPREIRIGSSLSPDERSRLIDLLRSYLDVFAWSYEDMSGLDPSIVKEEIRKQLSVGFLSVVEYPEWLAKVIPVPKKDGRASDVVLHGWLFWNAGATYQRAATTLFHDMMHIDVEVYVDDMIVKSRDRTDHLAALQRFFERIRQFRLRLNPKKCTFGVASGKLLGHIVSERGIEIDPKKIRAILDMPAPRTEKEIRGFLGRLQYISRFIARLTDICEPIFRLLRKNQPTVWSDDCQRAFERIKECLLSPPVLVPPTSGHPLLLYLSVSDMALGCMLAQLDDLGKESAIYYLSKRMLEYECKYIMIERLCLALVWATRRLRHYMTEYSVLLVLRLDPLRYLFDRPVLTSRLMRWLVLLTEFDIHYVTQKSVKGSIVADHLASLSLSNDRSVDDDFPDEQIVSMTSITGWRLYFDGAANQSGFCIGILLISPQGDHIPISVRLAFFDHHRLTNNIVEYEACITGLETAFDLGIRQLEIHGDSNLVIQQTQSIWRTRDEKLKPYHAYLDLLIDGFDVLRPLLIETRSAPAYYCLIGEIEDQIELPWYHDIYQFLSYGTYLESTSAKDRRALRQLATRFVICRDALYRRSPDDLLLLCLDRTSADQVMREVHARVCGPHMGGHMLALWGVDIIGKISPKSSSGHEYILVAIDYFTKWVEAASYARLTAARVAKFIRSHIICRYEVPHELISDRGVHFRGEVDTLIQEYGIQHHRSFAYRPQTNGAVEAVNKNIKRILRKMVETSRDWSEKLHFALWAYRTSFCTSTGATPYSLVYGIEAVLPVEIEMRSLRVALEQHVSEAEWVQSRYDHLSLLDEKRLRVADHAQAYQRKMTRAFKKRVRPRKFQRGDLVLKVLRGLISDPRGKFRPSWSGPYVIRDLTRERAAWLTDLDGNQFTEPVNVDQLKKFYA
ncbi:Retrovirus-related Pol polyprotein from transposon 297 [Vitis vinifera]|uniref:Retrovirus-related Pol polyprotein from transposon 297 n=1 Tax=Vitis vinifera TaxID=29760 RepID=A0A438HT41_VITVI|nr:Retrovirus-related Pol polyprotein from transposon 297 [Vitis vinifera]